CSKRRAYYSNYDYAMDYW
nr:immunoglobulin heavy chain junction region [Mus musculus]